MLTATTYVLFEDADISVYIDCEKEIVVLDKATGSKVKLWVSGVGQGIYVSPQVGELKIEQVFDWRCARITTSSY